MTAHNALFQTSVSLFERRDGDRQLTISRAARITSLQGQEQLGIIRNVSVGGAMIEAHTVAAIGDRLFIEARGCERMSGRVVWSNALRHGVAFDHPLGEKSLGKFAATGAGVQLDRAPRFNLDMEARLRVARTWHDVRLCDLSQGGAKIDCPAVPTEDEPVVLRIADLGFMPAFIRWRRDDKVGLLFAKPLPFTMLSAWLADLSPDLVVGGPERPGDPLGPTANYI